MERYLILSIHNKIKKLSLYDNGKLVQKISQIPLSQFSQEIQAAFANAGDGDKQTCDPATKLKCLALKLRQEPEGVHNRQALTAPVAGGRNQTHHNGTTHTITGLSPGQNNSATIHFSDGSQQPAEKLGLADQIVGTQPGTSFLQSRKLNAYAPEIQAGLGTMPDINKNPYNFAEWSGRQPWNPWTQEEREKYSTLITHEQEHAERLSGCIEVTLTAQSPVFIPHSSPEDGTLTSDFFKAYDGSQESYAIPGSSFKGVVRGLFESLTNSRFGVSNQELLKNPPLYRRRSSKMYRIVHMPTPNQVGQVQEYKFTYLNQQNEIQNPNRSRMTEADILNIQNNPGQHQGIASFRANLFWVKPEKHKHDKKKFAFQSINKNFNLSYKTLTQFQSMKNHIHFQNHPENVQNAAGNFYQGRPDYAQAREELFALQEGDFIMGIVAHNEIACFGKNVNFLWPGEFTPQTLMGEFLQRTQADSQLEGSDMAEAVFGFIGDDGQKKGSHSFKGRVRFTPLWAQGAPEAMPELQLMPLTSPSGTKLKARPLYLKPSAQGLSADYSDNSVALKGRKFYWHQKAPDGQIAKVHDYRKMKQANGPGISPEMLPKSIRPLPAQTVFKGNVHFSNLSQEELGALLTALNPELVFQNGNAQYGLKIGKGKPRGLGSVRSTLEVSILKPAKERYCTLESGLFIKTELQEYIKAYKSWCSEKSGQQWDALPFVQDLKKLLQLPETLSVRVYPPKFDMFGWMPEFDSPQGEPKNDAQKRPKAMKAARDVQP